MQETGKVRNLNPELELFFCNLEGIGIKGLQNLFAHVPDLEQIYSMTEQELSQILTKKQCQSFFEKKRTWRLREKTEQLLQNQISFVSFWNESYPAALRKIASPPKILYYKGKLPQNTEKCVAVVGTRNCTAYGRKMAESLGESLAAHGVSVVSGMARGIDSYSQQYALEVGGCSYGILGCGVDICYPPENRKLYTMLQDRGAVISEYAPGTAPAAGLFPARNRIISGMSQAVIVVEAREKSGTLITVDMALEQGKEVFAVPGRITDTVSNGCNRLIRQGAGILCDMEEVWKCLEVDGTNLLCSEAASEAGLDEAERSVYALIDEYPRTTEEIARELMYRRNPLPYSELAGIMVNLCLKKKIRQIDAYCYVRT